MLRRPLMIIKLSIVITSPWFWRLLPTIRLVLVNCWASPRASSLCWAIFARIYAWILNKFLLLVTFYQKPALNFLLPALILSLKSNLSYISGAAWIPLPLLLPSILSSSLFSNEISLKKETFLLLSKYRVSLAEFVSFWRFEGRTNLFSGSQELFMSEAKLLWGLKLAEENRDFSLQISG